MQCVLYINPKPKSLAHSPQHLAYMLYYLCKIRLISVRNDRAMPQSVTHRTLMTEAKTVPTRVRVEARKTNRNPGVRDPNIFHDFVLLGFTIIVDFIN
jgi:hypothetical protein